MAILKQIQQRYSVRSYQTRPVEKEKLETVLQAARLVAMRDRTFHDYLLKKRQEGKHFNVALSHVGKKLVRVIFHMLQTNRTFVPQS